MICANTIEIKSSRHFDTKKKRKKKKRKAFQKISKVREFKQVEILRDKHCSVVISIKKVKCGPLRMKLPLFISNFRPEIGRSRVCYVTNVEKHFFREIVVGNASIRNVFCNATCCFTWSILLQR